MGHVFGSVDWVDVFAPPFREAGAVGTPDLLVILPCVREGRVLIANLRKRHPALKRVIVGIVHALKGGW